MQVRWDRDRSRVFVHDLAGKLLCEARDERLYGLTDQDVRELNSRRKAARRICREALPAQRFAHGDLTTEAMVAAQARFAAAQVGQQRKAVGAVSAPPSRPLQLLPGVASQTGTLSGTASGGAGAKDRTRPPARPDVVLDFGETEPAPAGPRAYELDFGNDGDGDRTDAGAAALLLASEDDDGTGAA